MEFEGVDRDRHATRVNGWCEIRKNLGKAGRSDVR
jgi:hypothetical protein